MAFSLLLSRTCIQFKVFSEDFRRLCSTRRRKLRAKSNSTPNGTPTSAPRATWPLDCCGDAHEDVAETNDLLADKAVVVEGSDNIGLEMISTFDESGRIDVEEFRPARERSVVDALRLLSP